MKKKTKKIVKKTKFTLLRNLPTLKSILRGRGRVKIRTKRINGTPMIIEDLKSIQCASCLYIQEVEQEVIRNRKGDVSSVELVIENQLHSSNCKYLK